LIIHNLEEFPSIVDYSARRLAPVVGLPPLSFTEYLMSVILVSLVPIPITVTAVALLLPSSVYRFRRAVREGYLEPWQLTLAIAAGVLTASPIGLLLLAPGAILARALG
jgi:hypothetical protein